MCTTCGCGENEASVTLAGHDHGHHHHPHPDSHVHTRTITLEQKVLAKNDLLAERNRHWLAERNIVALNITSSPGAGKTTLLERTIREVGRRRPVVVIEGDQETLLRLAVEGLRDNGFDVITHHRVPPNDGGIALGPLLVGNFR